MGATFRSEALKLWHRGTAVVALAMAAFMVVTMLMSVSGAGDVVGDRGPAGLILSRTQLAASDGLARSLGNAIAFVGIAALTLVALNVGAEYAHGALRNLLVRQPNRVIILTGKAGAVLAIVAAAVIFTAIVGILSAFLLAPGNDVDTTAWTSGDGVVATIGGVASLVLATWGWAAMGLLLGVILRAAGPAIGIGVAYAIPVEVLLTEILGDYARWLPGQILQTLARGGSDQMSHWVAAFGSVGVIAVCLVLATVVFHSRDVAT